LDFGIAKLLKPEAVTAGQTIAHTATHEWLMTPEYAAPEQIRGEAITTRTDVYALGAVLFELLTGRRPFDFKNTTPFEMARMIAEVEPPTTSSLRRALSPDLDNIILMAMRKQADRRYASVDQLSDDLRRYLEGFPVLARPDSRAYRLKKFVSRNKVAVAAATLAILLLAGSAVAMAILAKRAQEEARAAQAVSDFLIGLFEVSNPSESRGNAVTAREILDKGVAKIDKDLGSQPAVQSRLLDTMGAVYDSLGLSKAANPLLVKGLALREKLYGPDALETATSLQTLATNYRGLGDLKKGEPLLRRVLAIRERRLGRGHIETLEVLNDLGLNLAEQGRNEEAEKILAESLAGKRKLLPAGSDPILKTLNNYAVCLVNQSKFEAARPMFLEILDSRRRRLGEDHPLTLFSYNNLGVTLLQLGRFEDAEPLLRTARFTRLRVLGPQHPMYFQSWTNHCSVLGYMGRLDESAQCSRECFEATLSKQGIDHPQTLEYGSYVVERSILTGDLSGARTLALQLIPHSRKGRRERQRFLEALADAYLYSGDLAAAERTLDDL
ncbi:MAG: tetratricopeptide repeat protein, partial [Bryobacteraceae bacterium]|nr:tetratricopeptide repeat protein [Bryobacteraceae bacterium]